ncbi:hypothetical protein [Vagococcus sp.]|uniref:hypothetical protein n=1 Tax=Vagococcus sp. TaxID=1933889 RepID=UPI003F9CDF2D
MESLLSFVILSVTVLFFFQIMIQQNKVEERAKNKLNLANTAYMLSQMSGKERTDPLFQKKLKQEQIEIVVCEEQSLCLKSGQETLEIRLNQEVNRPDE